MGFSEILEIGKIGGCESEIYRLVRRNRWFPKRNGTCRTWNALVFASLTSRYSKLYFHASSDGRTKKETE